MPGLLASLGQKPTRSWPGPPTHEATEQAPSHEKALHAELVSAIKAAAAQAAQLEKLRKLLALAGPGFDAASADQFKPNRMRYRELRAKTPDTSGSLQADGV